MSEPDIPKQPEENVFKIVSPKEQTLILEKNDDDVPQWPVRNPSFSGEFGQGDKAHQERAKSNNQTISHRGTDVVGKKGEAAYPMLSGIVNRVYNWNKGDKATQGNMVVIDHPKFGLTTKYMHLDSISVTPGQEVKKDTQIGTVGNTGNAMHTGAHIHFELEKGGSPLNARDFIDGKKELVPIVEKKAMMTHSIRMAMLSNLVKVAADRFWEDEDD